MPFPKIIAVVGPTASGKTNWAIQISKALGAPIASFDSRQFYKEMTIGTAKPSIEELKMAPHAFVNQFSVLDAISAGTFAQLFNNWMQNQNTSFVVLVGGSGLYLKSLLFPFHALPNVEAKIRTLVQSEYHEKGLAHLQSRVLALDPVQYLQMDIQNPQRLMRVLEICLSGYTYSELVAQQMPAKSPYNYVAIAPLWPRQTLYQRIDARVEQMMQAGLKEEVKSLLPLAHLPALQTVGYTELFAYFRSQCSLEEAIAAIAQNTRRYAKRQTTWFKNQLPDLVWLDAQSPNSLLEWLQNLKP